MRDEGLTLIELLVVTLVLGVVGSVVTTGVIQGMQTSRDAQERIHALTELEAGAHRATRELRAANPLWPEPSGDSVTATVYRDGARFTYTYEVQADGSEFVEHRVVFEDEDSTDPVSESTTVIARDLAQDTITTFGFHDRSGQPLDPADADFTVAQVARVVVTLGAELSTGEIIEVQTAATVRNAKGGG